LQLLAPTNISLEVLMFLNLLPVNVTDPFDAPAATPPPFVVAALPVKVLPVIVATPLKTLTEAPAPVKLELFSKVLLARLAVPTLEIFSSIPPRLWPFQAVEAS
jgi:hypothetical protein